MAGEIEGEINLKSVKRCWFKNIYMEVKPHSSKVNEDKVVEGDRDSYNNDEYAYCFLVERAPAIIRVWNGE